MNDIDTSKSEIANFYKDKTVFLTGATGFVGKLVLEKLLRVFRVKKVYILVRPKKGKERHERYQDIFESPVFDIVKETNKNFLDVVQMISGDCALVNVGVSDEDWKLLEEEVEVIIHCAATVRFDQILRTAYNINVRATKDLISHAKQMKHLKSFVYVSTAYSNCYRAIIEETVYEPPLTHNQLENFLATMTNDDYVARLTPALIGEFPNTYTFTKCICEQMIEELSKELPVAIVRPSMIVSTYREPLGGYVDNFYGPVGVTVGVAMGVLRTLHCIEEYKADMVPADFVVNILLTVAWKQYTNGPMQRKVPVYNLVSAEHSLNWKSYMNALMMQENNYASRKQVWKVMFYMFKQKWLHVLATFFLHTLPAHVFDFGFWLLGKKPQMVEGYNKINKFTTAIEYFTLREWKFGWRNTKKLWGDLSEVDQQLCSFDITSLEWDDYIKALTLGGLKYLIKEDMDKMPENIRRYKIIVAVHWTLVTLFVISFSYFFMYLFRSV